MIENRKSYRLPFRRKFLFATKDQVYTGNSANISAGGIFVTILESEKIKRDALCRCLFLLNFEDEPVCLDGKVMRIIAQSTNPEETPGVGFQFVSTEARDVDRLQDFMDASKKNFEVASTILSSGEPDLASLEPLVKDMHLPPFSDLGELRFYVERILKAIEMVDSNS